MDEQQKIALLAEKVLGLGFADCGPRWNPFKSMNEAWTLLISLGHKRSVPVTLRSCYDSYKVEINYTLVAEMPWRWGMPTAICEGIGNYLDLW